MATSTRPEILDAYLDFQASVGITKHLGGMQATQRLLSLCRAESANEILYIGSGIGIGPAYIARNFACRVMAVDISEKMLDWSRRRAKENKVDGKIEFRKADVLDLPFPDGRFDAVLVESVIAFVEDKARAGRECVRVTKPGGYVGWNESFLADDAAEDEKVRSAFGSFVPYRNVWQNIWDQSGLVERTLETHRIDTRQEIRDRIRWVGFWWSMRGLARAAYSFLADPVIRKTMREVFSSDTLKTMDMIDYAIMTGKKQ